MAVPESDGMSWRVSAATRIWHVHYLPVRPVTSSSATCITLNGILSSQTTKICNGYCRTLLQLINSHARSVTTWKKHYESAMSTCMRWLPAFHTQPRARHISAGRSACPATAAREAATLHRSPPHPPSGGARCGGPRSLIWRACATRAARTWTRPCPHSSAGCARRRPATCRSRSPATCAVHPRVPGQCTAPAGVHTLTLTLHTCKAPEHARFM